MQQIKLSDQIEALAFDLQGGCVHNLTSSFGILTMFSKNIQHQQCVKNKNPQKHMSPLSDTLTNPYVTMQLVEYDSYNVPTVSVASNQVKKIYLRLHVIFL